MKNIKAYINFGLENQEEMTRENDYVIILPTNRTFKKDETLDEGNFEFYSSCNTPIKPFTRFKIEVDGEETFYYGHSQVENVSFKNNLYKHTLFLIEPTKILERHILGARTFSSESSFFTTYEDLVNLILETCYPKAIGLGTTTPIDNFYFESQGDERLQKTAREFFTSDTTTLFEVLEEIALSINAYPRVVDFDKIIFEFFEDGENVTIENGKIFNEKKTRDLDRYSTSLYSKISNVISKNPVSSVDFPNEKISDKINFGVAERTEVLRFNEENAELVTEYPIYKIKKIELMAGEGSDITDGDGFHNNGLKFKGSDGNDYLFSYFNDRDQEIQVDTFTTYKFVESMDITNFVFDKREWDLFDEDDGTTYPWKTVVSYQNGSNFYTGNQSKKCSLYFEEGSKVIKNAHQFVDSGFWIKNSERTIFNIATAIWRVRGEPLSWEPFVPVQPPVDDSNEQDWQVESFSDGTTPMFRITYETIQDYTVKQYRNKWEGFEGGENSIVYNQNDSLVDFDLFGENIKGKIKRIGNEQFEISLFTNENLNIKTGDKIDGYVITQINIETYNKFDKILLKLDKNFNRKSNDVSIQNQKRLFAIRDDNFTVDRFVNVQNFLTFEKEDKGTGGYTSQFTIEKMARMFTDKGKIDDILYTIEMPKQIIDFVRHTGYEQSSQTFNQDYIKSPIVLTTENAFLLNFGFDDLRETYRSIKYKSSMSGGSLLSNRLNSVRRPNFYCDENGEVEDFKITLYQQMEDYPNNKEIGYDYPKINADFKNKLYSSSFALGDIIFDQTFVIKKDAREILKFNFQFNFLSGTQDFITTKNLVQKNILFRKKINKNYPQEIYVQPLNEKQNERYLDYDITKGEKEEITDGTTTSGFECIFNINNTKLEITVPQNWKDTKEGFAFVDGEDNVLLIINDTEIEEIYMNDSNKY